MAVRSGVWIVVCGLIWGMSCDQQLFAQKRKPGSTKDKAAASKSDAELSPDDDPSRFPTLNQSSSPIENTVRQAQAAYHDGDFEKCIDLTTQVLDVNSRHAVARYHRASALIDLGRQDRDIAKVRAGIADARQALGIAGKQYLIFHIPYFYGLTTLAEMENRPAHAELTIQVATPLMQRPDLPSGVKAMVYFQRALAKMYLQDYPGAATDYSEAIKIDPQFQAAHFGRAEAYTKAGYPDKARECYDLAAKAMPDDPLVYNNRGTFQLQQGRTDAAIVDFTKALELEPTFAMAALNRGFAHAQRLDWFEAENDYLLTLQTDPNQILALKMLGTARAAQGKLQPAIEAHTQALKLNPQDAEIYSGRGFVRFIARDYAGASADFAKSRELNPGDTLSVPWRYWAQAKAGQEAAGRQELEAFVKSQPATPNWHVTLCRYILGQVDDAALVKFANDSTVATTKAQWQCEAHFFQGLQSEAANQPEDARQHFEACVKTNQSQLMAYLGAKIALAANR